MKRLWLQFLAGMWVFGGTALAAERPPNIVYLLIDDLGYADCGFMGCKDIRTPHIDKLAKEGTVLESLPFNGIHAPHQVPARDKEPYKDLKEPRRSIAGMLAAVDDAIGQITVALDEKGLRRDTLIIFSSDNGGPNPGKATMNTPLRAGKGTLYEGGVRACAFVNWPGRISRNLTNKEPIHAVDWYPTLLKLAGAPMKQRLALDGLDLWPVLTQGAKSQHDAILLAGMVPGKAAVRMGDWKLLLNASGKNAEEAPDDEATATESVELYNLAEDIGETKNLAAAQPMKVKELRRRLDAFLKNAAPPGNAVARPAGRRNAIREFSPSVPQGADVLKAAVGAGQLLPYASTGSAQ